MRRRACVDCGALGSQCVYLSVVGILLTIEGEVEVVEVDVVRVQAFRVNVRPAGSSVRPDA